MKILLLGCKGMAGNVMRQRLLAKGHTVVGTSRFARQFDNEGIVHFDAMDVGSWVGFFESQRCDVVVNCIGILVQAAERSPHCALTVNTLLPKFLEAFYSRSETRVIHISTDCVFNGSRGKYTVFDDPDEVTTYGRTKALGEIVNAKDLTIRTSIIGLELLDKPNAADNCGLLHWVLSQKAGSEVLGFTKCFWSGISTIELADAVLWYLENPAHGLHQISREKGISKFDLVSLMSATFAKNLKVEPHSEKSINKTLVASEGSFPITASYEEMLRRIADSRK